MKRSHEGFRWYVFSNAVSTIVCLSNQPGSHRREVTRESTCSHNFSSAELAVVSRGTLANPFPL